MKTLTVRLPEALVNEIEAECRERPHSNCDVIRERLGRAEKSVSTAKLSDTIADWVGSVSALPAALCERK